MILLTGASGFLGAKMLEALPKNNVKVVVREYSPLFRPYQTYEYDFSTDTLPLSVFDNVNTVIHSAARVHIMDDNVAEPLAEFRSVNTAGTLNLAKQASDSGVKRFIFISSIKVNGESTTNRNCFTEKDIKNPLDPYGVSKAEAEDGLQTLGKETGMEIVIIRPPLVYGPGVKANFAMMLKLISFGIPLPFGSIVDNRRSMVYVGNLVDLIVKCISHPNAANQTFLVSDDDDLSTARMIKELSNAMGRKNWSLPVSPKLFEIAGEITGKSEVVGRLCGSLKVDITKTKKLLNWTPPFTVQEGFAETAKHFLINK